MGAETKTSLGRHLLELLQESPHGLTPPTLLDLVVERGWIEPGTGRGPYQRILRQMALFESQGWVRKVGRRYVANLPALKAAMEREAAETLALALEQAHLPIAPETWLARLRTLTGIKDPPST